MRRVARPLEKMGARVAFEGDDGRLPMTVAGGALVDVEWTSDTASAQVKSAVLLAGVTAGVEVTVREPHRSRDHTERMLAARGVDVYVNEQAVHVPAGQRVGALDVAVPGDPVVGRLLRRARRARRRGHARPPRGVPQRDAHGLLPRAGAHGRPPRVDDERREAGGRRDVLARAGRGCAARPSRRRGARDVDELPLLACVAACAEGDRVRGAAELRVKESDRIAAVVGRARAVGADADELPTGSSCAAGPRARRRVVTHGDHRLAMAFACSGPARDAVGRRSGLRAVSYPRFGPTSSATPPLVRRAPPARMIVAIDGPPASGSRPRAWVARAARVPSRRLGALYRALTSSRSASGDRRRGRGSVSRARRRACAPPAAPASSPRRRGPRATRPRRGDGTCRRGADARRARVGERAVRSRRRRTRGRRTARHRHVVFPDAGQDLLSPTVGAHAAACCSGSAARRTEDEIAEETERLVRGRGRDADACRRATRCRALDTTYLTQPSRSTASWRLPGRRAAASAPRGARRAAGASDARRSRVSSAPDAHFAAAR
jgi:3-phosphoshikimate 1-carboxyvinyltransferase